MAKGYFATKLSENIGETPEGFLVAKACVLARTGFQKYNVSDLINNFPAERLEELNIDTSNPHASIDLYRPAEEVFAPHTVLSAEGKPFCDSHPPKFVDTENFTKYARGHMQHIHKGDAALDSGDWPLVGDIIVNDAEPIRKIHGGTRELSLGYTYDIARSGSKILQTNFMINHVALVPSGRAGSEARIYDSAPVAAIDDATMRQVEAAAWEPSSAPEVKPVPITTVKEKATVKNPNSIFGRLLKALALDTETNPEDLVEASRKLHRAMDEESESEEEKKKRESEDASKRAADAKRMKDEAEEKEKKEASDKKAKDEAESAAEKKRKDDEMAAKDSACKPGESGHMDCTKDKCMAKDRGAKDADGGDHRSRMHAALDDKLDEHEKLHGPLEGKDADKDELMEIMSQIMAEEQQDPEDPDGADDDASQMLEPVGEMPGETMANDAAAEMLAVIEKSTERRTLQQAFDAAPLDSEFDFLKAIKPAIAKSKDVKVRRAYDAQVRKYTRTSAPAHGGYAAFGAAAHAHDSARINDAARLATGIGVRPLQDNTKIQQMYNDARNGKHLTPSK